MMLDALANNPLLQLLVLAAAIAAAVWRAITGRSVSVPRAELAALSCPA